MQYSFLLGAVLASLVSAQDSFTNTDLSTVTVGSPFTITWDPSSSGTVSLFLRQGNAKALTNVATIASSIPNSGSYTWTPSSTLPSGSGYALQIVDDANSSIDNYSSQFAIAGGSSAPADAAAQGQANTPPVSSVTSASGATTTTPITFITGVTYNGSITTTTTNKGGSNSTTPAVTSGTSTATGKDTGTGTGGTKTTAAQTGSGTGTGTGTSTASGTKGSATGNEAAGLKSGKVGAVMGGLFGALVVALAM